MDYTWCCGESRRERQGMVVLWDVLCALSELNLEVWPLNISQPVSPRGLLGVRIPPCCICFWSEKASSPCSGTCRLRMWSACLGQGWAHGQAPAIGAAGEFLRLFAFPARCLAGTTPLTLALTLFTSVQCVYSFGLIFRTRRSRKPCWTLSCSDWRGLKAIWLQSSGLETNPQSHYLFPGSPFLKTGYQWCYRSLWGCCPKWIALLNQHVCWIPAAPTIRAMDAITWI